MASLDYPNLLSEKHPSVIHTEAEHKHWLAELNQILERGATTDAERQYCELLSLLIEDFEKKNYQLTAKATPLAALRELMEVNGLQQKDLLDVFKHKAVISEVLNGKRGLTLEHIRRLARRFHLSVEVFI